MALYEIKQKEDGQWCVMYNDRFAEVSPCYTKICEVPTWFQNQKAIAMAIAESLNKNKNLILTPII